MRTREEIIEKIKYLRQKEREAVASYKKEKVQESINLWIGIAELNRRDAELLEWVLNDLKLEKFKRELGYD